jgi:hypothetical protein
MSQQERPTIGRRGLQHPGNAQLVQACMLDRFFWSATLIYSSHTRSQVQSEVAREPRVHGSPGEFCGLCRGPTHDTAHDRPARSEGVSLVTRNSCDIAPADNSPEELSSSTSTSRCKPPAP